MCVLCAVKEQAIKEIESGSKHARALNAALDMGSRVVPETAATALMMAKEGGISGTPDDLQKYFGAGVQIGINSAMVTVTPAAAKMGDTLRDTYLPFAAAMRQYENTPTIMRDFGPAFTHINAFFRGLVGAVKSRYHAMVAGAGLTEAMLALDYTPNASDLIVIYEHAMVRAADETKEALNFVRKTAPAGTSEHDIQLQLARGILTAAQNEYAELCDEAQKFIRGEENTFGAHLDSAM